jgi:hypothetical protein
MVMKKGFCFLGLIFAITLGSDPALAKGTYVDVKSPDLAIGNTTVTHLEDFANFVSATKLPTTISFNVKISGGRYIYQDCAFSVVDAQGAEFQLSLGKDYPFSHILFPATFKVVDLTGTKKCGHPGDWGNGYEYGISLTGITVHAEALKTFEVEFSPTINQNSPEPWATYFAGLQGVPVQVRVAGKYFENFTEMSCLNTYVSDVTGAIVNLDTIPDFRADVAMVLPVSMGHIGKCLTSALPADYKESADADLSYKISLSLIL